MSNEINLDSVIKILNDNMEYCKVDKSNAEEDLMQLGMTSIEFIHIVVSLEEEFDCEIPDSKLLFSEMNTANKILEVLR